MFPGAGTNAGWAGFAFGTVDGGPQDVAVSGRPGGRVLTGKDQDGTAKPRTVVVGAGFAGLECAAALGAAGELVTLVDRHNYHLFVPLLYQVATAALSPADVAQPIRRILRRHRSVTVRMGDVTGVETDRRRVHLSDGSELAYDRLVIAAGSVCSYFGHDEWARYAPCPRSVDDAGDIRSRLLLAFERAEIATDPTEVRALLTSVVVGGGPTGVEMAGAIAELARHTLAKDFRRIDPTAARVLLVEAGPLLLPGFSEGLSKYTAERLRRLRVEVVTNTAVEDISADGVVIGGAPIAAATVIWGAGMRAAPAADWIGVGADRGGRIAVRSDLSVPGLDGVFAIGDVAACRGPDGKPLPGLAQVAKQQGRHLGRALAAASRDGRALPAFRFRNRGNVAIIGRNAAVFETDRFRLRGFLAWLLWAVVHIYLLVGFEQRVLVAVQWLWRYLSYERGARLITRLVGRSRGGRSGSAPGGR